MMRGDELHSGYLWTSDDSKMPENMKVTTLGEIDDPESSYSFDFFWVFRHNESGRVFYGTDSGCSCPSPFENDHWDGPDKNSFTEITVSNLEEAIKQMWSHYDGHSSLQDEKRDLERAIREAIRG